MTLLETTCADCWAGVMADAIDVLLEILKSTLTASDIIYDCKMNREEEGERD